MTTIEEKIQEITIPFICRRIKRELQDIKKAGIFCDDNNVSIINNCETGFDVIFKNNKDNRLYKFIVPYNYPFLPPKLELNNKPYSSYFSFRSDKFKELFYRHKGERCFCCETKLCGTNWGPPVTFIHIIEEINSFHKDCREIADIVIVDVIKRKYLIDDINILEWLY